jgi:hypothetical protein
MFSASNRVPHSFHQAACSFVLSFAALSARTPLASADIVETGGAAVIAEPPADIRLGRWQSNTEIRVWFERERFLVEDQTLNHVNTGLVTSGVPRVSGILSAGTPVQSYMIRLETVTNNPVELSGYVVFDSPILGVIIGKPLLDSSDPVLSRPGVTYNTNDNRGLEFNGTPDAFTISADRLRVDFTLWTQLGPSDDIRVVTEFECPADFNSDRVVDFFDYLDFVESFSGSSSTADFNSDGVIDFFDYLDFVAHFSAGC